MTVVFNVNRVVKTTLTVEIDVAGAPMMPTHYYYEQDMMYKPERLVLQWPEGEAPLRISVVGTDTSGRIYKGGFGLKQAPQWIREAVHYSIKEAETWDWTPAGVTR